MRRKKRKRRGYPRFHAAERHWYQFSLRALLIAIALFMFGLVCAKIAYEAAEKMMTPVFFRP